MTIKPIAPVSVIIPCYRCSSTIHRAVQSVVDQTQKPAELILVDDASGDDTLGVLREIEQQYPDLIKVISLTENKGAGSARNAGWEIAYQPYIAFLDSDDTWHPNKLAFQYEIMSNNQSLALSGHQCVIYKNDNALSASQANLINLLSIVKPFSMLFKNRFSTSTVMLNKDISFRFKEGKRYAEDFYLWQQIAFAGYSIGYINCPLAYVHKALYGVGGLSAQLWNMEKGELNNFYCLYQEKKINLILYLLASVFSLLKFCKRYFFARLLKR